MEDHKADLAHRAYEAGRALLERGDLPAAIAQLEASVAESPHFKSLELLGEALLRSGDATRAVVPLAAATTLNAQVRAPSLLAEALLKLGDAVHAHQVATMALDRDPMNRKAREVFDSTLVAYQTWNSK
jgi:tetratricopeptide (TPR) repeat protein